MVDGKVEKRDKTKQQRLRVQAGSTAFGEKTQQLRMSDAKFGGTRSTDEIFRRFHESKKPSSTLPFELIGLSSSLSTIFGGDVCLWSI